MSLFSFVAAGAADNCSAAIGENCGEIRSIDTANGHGQPAEAAVQALK